MKYPLFHHVLGVEEGGENRKLIHKKGLAPERMIIIKIFITVDEIKPSLKAASTIKVVKWMILGDEIRNVDRHQRLEGRRGKKKVQSGKTRLTEEDFFLHKKEENINQKMMYVRRDRGVFCWPGTSTKESFHHTHAPSLHEEGFHWGARQSMGSFPTLTRYSFASLKGLLPKKPLLALSPLGCTPLMTLCRDLSIHLPLIWA